jgi:hypothetical protein
MHGASVLSILYFQEPLDSVFCARVDGLPCLRPAVTPRRGRPVIAVPSLGSSSDLGLSRIIDTGSADGGRRAVSGTSRFARRVSVYSSTPSCINLDKETLISCL